MPFFHHLAIDLGTTYSVVYLMDEDRFFQEPTFAALKNRQRIPLAIGMEAKKMVGYAPHHIQVIQPLRDGVISDFEVCSAFLQILIKKALNNSRGIVRNVLFCLPWGATDVEVRAYRKQLELFPFSRIFLSSGAFCRRPGGRYPHRDPQWKSGG